MNPFLSSLLLVAGLAAATAPAARAEPPHTLDVTPGLLDRLVTEAQGQSPALQSAEARAEVADAASSGVRTWEDPTASFGVWAPGSGGFGASKQGNLVYGIDQKLPLHGRPGLLRRVAQADAARAQFAADYAGLKLRRDLTLALLGFALASREAALAREDLAWLDATASAVDHRYRVGQASQVDWLKAQTARAVAADNLITQEEEQGHRSFSINRLLNRDLHASWPDIALPALQPPVGYTPQLVAAALAAEPQLRILREESASAQAAADLTQRARLPDVSIGLQAWQYSGDGAMKQAMATVSFSVPWLNRSRYHDDWRRDEARKRASDLAADDYALSLREELHHHVVDLDAARRQAVLYEGQLVPLTEQTLASAQTAWEHGLGSFQDILDAHRLLIADRLGLAQALTQQANLLADLCLLTASRDPATVLGLAREGLSHDNHVSSAP